MILIIMKDTHTLSMAGSKKYDFDDFDEDAEKLGFDRSQFLQFLYEGFKEKKKLGNNTILIILLLGFAIVISLLFLR